MSSSWCWSSQSVEGAPERLNIANVARGGQPSAPCVSARAARTPYPRRAGGRRRSGCRVRAAAGPRSSAGGVRSRSTRRSGGMSVDRIPAPTTATTSFAEPGWRDEDARWKSAIPLPLSQEPVIEFVARQSSMHRGTMPQATIDHHPSLPASRIDRLDHLGGSLPGLHLVLLTCE